MTCPPNLLNILYISAHLIHDLPYALLARKQHNLMAAAFQPRKDAAQPLIIIHCKGLIQQKRQFLPACQHFTRCHTDRKTDLLQCTAADLFPIDDMAAKIGTEPPARLYNDTVTRRAGQFPDDLRCTHTDFSCQPAVFFL